LIFDLLGREVITLVDEVQSPGYRTINWNGMDNLGNNSGAGMYFYHLTAGHFSQTKKMVLLK
jgi:flagellar hook assembly protein FlgD